MLDSGVKAFAYCKEAVMASKGQPCNLDCGCAEVFYKTGTIELRNDSLAP